jgi:GNAT superfamily N-acetyltransferase
MGILIRPASSDEGEQLRRIAIAAKAHWGYDRGEVVRWASQGDFSAQGLRAKEFFVAEIDASPVAFASLIAGDVAVLDDLWVEPDAMGHGVGSALFRAVAARAAELGADSLEWEAEPHAGGFYERMGGRRLRDGPPSEWGRILPVMGIDL